MLIKQTAYFGKNFKDIIQRGNKYEDYVLEIMNLSSSIFNGLYEKVEEQESGQPDYVDKATGEKFDAKLMLSSEQCKQLCGNNNPVAFFREMSEQNNELYDSIVNNIDDDNEITELIKKQLEKPTMVDKNVVLLFTFPIGNPVECITAYFVQDALGVLLSKCKPFLGDRRLFAICPMLDGKYEIREAGQPSPEFITYSKLDKYFKWSI